MTGPRPIGGRKATSIGTFQPILIASAVFMAVAWLTVFKQAMLVPLSHDEHQFVAAGRLLAGGMLPYRDFPSNHMPYLTLVYGAVFSLTQTSMLPARAVSAVCAALAASLVFHLTGSFFRDRSRPLRFIISAAGSLTLITNPLFVYTSGRSWNHDLPTLFIVAAAALFLHRESTRPTNKWITASGVFVGLAAGARLTYVLTAIPFLLAISLQRGESVWKQRRSQWLAFGAGFLVASLPWIALFVAAPRPFLFGNLTYQSLNTDYRELLSHRVGETLLGKGVYFFHVLVDKPANLLLLLTFAIVALMVGFKILRRRAWLESEAVILGGLALVLLVSAFAATPSWYQYFYGPVPFLILAALYGVSFVWQPGVIWGRAFAGGAVVLFLASGASLISQSDWGSLREPDKWIPVQAHQLGEELLRRAGHGKVLTLSPIFPIEGGLGTYKELATGPFSWRVAPLLTERQRREFVVMSYSDLETTLRNDPPAAILVGFEAGNEGFELGDKGGLEDPLEDYARKHGYTAWPLKSQLTAAEVTLWVR